MSDRDEILKRERTAFDKWNRKRYHNRTIHGDALAWDAWRAAICNYLKTELDEGDASTDYSISTPRFWAKKEIQALAGFGRILAKHPVRGKRA